MALNVEQGLARRKVHETPLANQLGIDQFPVRRPITSVVLTLTLFKSSSTCASHGNIQLAPFATLIERSFGVNLHRDSRKAAVHQLLSTAH